MDDNVTAECSNTQCQNDEPISNRILQNMLCFKDSKSICPAYVGIEPIKLKGYDVMVEKMYNRSEFALDKKKDKLLDDHRCYQEVNSAKFSNKDLIKVDLSLLKNNRPAYMILEIKEPGKTPIGAKKKGMRDFVVRNEIDLTQVG